MDVQWLLYLPLALALYIFTTHFLHKLRNLPPTPLLNLPFIGHLYLLKKPLHRTLAKISNTYGPVLLLQFGSRRILVVSSPSAAEDCFTKNDVVFANRPHLLAGKHIGYNYTTLAWSSYGDHWRNLRKISSVEILSTHRLQMLNRIRIDEVESMIRGLNRDSEQQRPVDMKKVFFELTINVVMNMIAGKRYYGENVEEGEEGKRFREIVIDTFRLGGSNIGDFLPVVKWLGVGGFEKRLVELQKRRDEFMQKLVEECKSRIAKKGGGETKTMIEMLLELQEKEPGYYKDQLIRSLMLEGRFIDMKSMFFDLTVNVMMRMIAGKRYYGENVEEVEEAKRFRQIVIDTFNLSGTNMEDFLPVVKWLGVGGNFEKRLVELQKRRDEFMQELVEECKRRICRINGGDQEVGSKSKTMIEILLELQEKEPDYYKDRLIKSLMLTLLAAGSDTSAGTMEWALSLLLNNPHVLKKAQIEIDNHIGYDRLIDESDIPDLPYLRSIVNETLRMYPAGPLLVPHESSEPCTVGGYRVPAGTMLLVNCWAIHNDPKNWEDARKFKPERFEGQEGSRDGFKWMPFGSGRRGCPGEGLAMRMLCFGLGSVIQCFDWERVGKDLVDMTEGGGLTMPKAKSLMAYCKARPSAAKLLSQI
ncbi:hypothetical protein ACJIZ3_025042 [Penstemon smallii]|uniref:(+)-piperitol/(+)-sesamin synthase n=1 Tax=Penstemon smallii TaxID=265156 RepID=A0ABD3TV80_9LAMI